MTRILQLVDPMAKEGSGKTYQIQSGDAYVFDGHESHYIRGGPDGAKIICIFSPACTGKEVSNSTHIFPKYVLCTFQPKVNKNYISILKVVLYILD